MARRKKSKKSYSRRRRRMGAIGGSNVTNVLGIVGGAIAARMVVSKVLPNVDTKIKNAGVIALGVFMPKLLKGDLGKALGNGMIAVGGAGLVTEFLPGLGAIEETIEFPVTVGEVPDNISVIAGDEVLAGDDLQVLAGFDEEE